MMKKLLTCLVTSCALISTASWAVEYQSPRTLSLGGAGRGAPMLTDAIYLNPAYSSLITSYSISGGYLWFDRGRNYNVSVQDSRTDLFQAGIGFTRREQNAAVSFGASKSFVERVGFGLGAKFVIDDNTRQTTSNLLFSTTFLATKWMYSSLIIDNLLESDASRARHLYRDIFLGFKFFAMREFLIYLDPFYTPNYSNGNKAGFSAGAELAMMADFYLRMGKFVDSEVSYLDTRGDGWAIGLGWIGPKLNLDYALHRVTSDHATHGNYTSHSAEMTIYF